MAFAPEAPAVKKAYFQRIKLQWNHPVVGLFLLGIASIIAFQYRYLGNIVDEGDKLAGGLLLTRGMLLYRDIFTHHLPFPYLWAAAFIRLFGPSIRFIRLSVIFYQIICFAIIIFRTRSYLASGIAAVVWALISHYYLGNLALYNMFAGMAVLVFFAITTNSTARKIPLSWIDLILLGLFSTIVLLSDPISSFVVLLAYLFLLVSKTGIKRTMLSAFIPAGFLLVFVIFLWVSGSLQSFYRDFLYFNQEIYSKYYPTSLREMIATASLQIVTGLQVFTPHLWFNQNLSLPFNDFSQVGQYLMAGYLWRIGAIFYSLHLLLFRKWITSAFVFLCSSLLLMRADVFLRMIPIVLLALLSTSWLLFNFPHFSSHDLLGSGSSRENIISKVVWYLDWALRIMAGVGLLWASYSSILYTATDPKSLTYNNNFRSYSSDIKKIDNLICGQKNVHLGYYPGDPLIYFLTGMSPISKYIYFWPWVAEVGTDDLIAGLKSGKNLVYVDRHLPIWTRSSKDFLRPVLNYLNQTYIQVEPGYYLSPELASGCGRISPSAPVQ